MKLLIVDDSRAMQTIVRRGIEQLGYDQLELKKADNGIDALNIVRQWAPDFIISDWHMPEMNGMELLMAVNREMLDIKIGFVTTESSEDRLQEAKNAGALFIVQKPFDNKTLHEAVEPILKRHIEEENQLTAEAEQKQQQETPTPEQATHEENNDTQNKDHISLPHIDILTKFINQLSTTPVFIRKTVPIVLEQKHYPCLLGLYGDKEKKSLHAIAIADHNAVCILGVLSGKVSAADLNKAFTEKNISKTIIENSQSVLGSLETTLLNTLQQEHLVLRSAKIMRKKNADLERLLSENANDRIDITMKMGDYPVGCFTLLVS